MAKNWALVIGINGYNPLNFSPLNYAKRDAEAVKTFFEQCGFEVCCFTDDSPPLTMPNGVAIPTQPTYGNLITFLQDRFAQPFLSIGDNCWFFFAGHGERHADKDYLMPMDANSRGKEVIAGLQVDQVRNWLTRSGADNVILLLDACRNQGSRGVGGIDPTEQKGVITISSCNSNQKSWEVEDLQHGIFTYALLEAMQLPTEQSCATVERLGNYLKSYVPELCQHYGKHIQNPRISADPPEKQYFILMPQSARQADIDLIKAEGLRLAFIEKKLQLAEQMFIRANVAARGLDRQIVDALTEIRIQMRGMKLDSEGAKQSEPVGGRSPAVAEPTTAPPPIAAKPDDELSSDKGEKRPDFELLPDKSSCLSPAATALGHSLANLASSYHKQLASDDDDLSSEIGIDYTRLRNLLKAQDWREADRETYRMMIRAVGKKEGKWFTADELLNFPCTDLKTIDRLWVKYSQGEFGFSVQKQIYVECGGKLDGKYPGDKIWDAFGGCTGWGRVNSKWISYFDITEDTSAPSGHLPGFWFEWGGVGYRRPKACLFSRVETCKL